MSDVSTPINILLVDDQALLRQALANLLEQDTELKIVGVASDGYEAIKQVALCRPDVVLLDIEMPNLDGLSTTQLITQRFPDIKVIVLSAHDNNVYLMNALRAGAKAYLLKNTLCEELIDTVRLVHKGYSQFSSDVFEKMLAGIPTAAPSPVGPLTNGAAAAPLAALAEDAPEEMILEDVLRSANLSPAILSRFEPSEIKELVNQILAAPEVAIALKSSLNQRTAEEPKNLALLYLHGALASHSWDQPSTAFKSLWEGFQAGLDQTTPTEALLLFYQEAAALKPTLAFSWLTQTDGPWNNFHSLPFLVQEATKLFGETSSQARFLLTLYRIRSLKSILMEHTNTLSIWPQEVA